MKFILGKKLEMSQVFDEKNNVLPVTKVLVTPSVVTQIKTLEKDGYNAIQVSFNKKKKLNKAQKGHFKDLGDFANSKEFRFDEIIADLMIIQKQLNSFITTLKKP